MVVQDESAICRLNEQGSRMRVCQLKARISFFLGEEQQIFCMLPKSLVWIRSNLKSVYHSYLGEERQIICMLPKSLTWVWNNLKPSYHSCLDEE